MNWVDAIAWAAVPAGDVIGVEVAGRDLALYGVEGAVYATDNRCTHGAARLCDGFVDGHTVECPLHQGRFDVRDGRPLGEPLETPVRCYPVRIADGRVLIAVD